MALNPLDIIAKGMRINPQVTRVLFPSVVLIACVALIGQLIKDPTTAIIGGLLVILAAIVLIVVAAIAAQQIGAIAIWVCRSVAGLFVAISLTLFTSWATDRPKPLPCLINPMSICQRVDQRPVVGPTCLKPDEKLPSGSCGQADGNYVVVNVRWNDPDGGLNVRASPDLKGVALGVLPPNGTELIVGTCESGWCQVQCKNVKGWSRDRFLALRSSDSYAVTGISQAALGLTVRNGPDQTCSAVESIPYNGKDVILHICQVSPTDGSRWCLVTHNGHSGWVPLDHLTPQN